MPELNVIHIVLLVITTVVGAVAALISTRTNPLIAAGATFGVWIAGHLSGEYAAVASELGFEPANTLVYAVVPDLDLLDLQTPVVTGVGIDPVAATAALGYGLVWLGILWALTVMSLRTRDVA